MDIADRLRPQGGRARVAINGARVDLRVSTLPASHGEKVVIRILDSRAALRSVESLGLDPVDGPRMQKLLEVREGLILVTGPTGSGKPPRSTPRSDFSSTVASTSSRSKIRSSTGFPESSRSRSTRRRDSPLPRRYAPF